MTPFRSQSFGITDSVRMDGAEILYETTMSTSLFD
jgi:hypothetical protein